MHGLVGELEYKVLVLIDKKSQKKIKTRLKPQVIRTWVSIS